jgi:hypothetical protein
VLVSMADLPRALGGGEASENRTGEAAAPQPVAAPGDAE